MIKICVKQKAPGFRGLVLFVFIFLNVDELNQKNITTEYIAVAEKIYTNKRSKADSLL